MWLLVGILLGAAMLALIQWLHRRHIKVNWYEYLIATMGLVLLIFSLQNFFATAAEHWSFGTPLTFFLVFGLPGITFSILAVLLVLWRYMQSTKS